MVVADNVHVLAEKISGIPVAMLGTRARDGCLKSRPMATQSAAFDGSLWFVTGAGSEKVQELRLDDCVCLAYADVAHQRYVSVTGRGCVVDDRGKVRELWTPLLEMWFEGADDPELRLLRVEVERAEYWDALAGRLVQLVGFLHAAVRRSSTPAT